MSIKELASLFFYKLHLAQPRDPFINRRMSGKDARQERGFEWLLNEEVRRGVRGAFELKRIVLEFFKRGGKAFGIAREEASRRIGKVLALSSNRQLDEFTNQRRENEQDDTDDGEPTAAATAAALVTADGKSRREVSKNVERANEHDDERHKLYIPVFDV